MRPKPAISIVMPARNEGERVAKAILSFSAGRSNLFPLEFVVVDDASGDGCCDGMENLLNWKRDEAIIKVVRLEQWSGIPFARNKGAEAATSPTLFITDANVEACQNWDIPVFREMRPQRVLCATIADTASSWQGYGCLLQLPSMGVDWLCNPMAFGGYVPICPCAGTILHAELFSRLGGYDTAMPVYGAAEPEFSVRTWLYGAEIVACPDLVLRHRFRPPEERKPFIEQIEFIQIKNYLRFALLYLNNTSIKDTLNHYFTLSPVLFEKAMQHWETDTAIMRRRNHLQAVLSRNFSWYQTKFNYKTMH